MEHIEAVAPIGGIARLSDSAATDTAIIFVHGFKGHPLKTWGQLPEIACADESDFWRKADLYFMSYRAERLHVDSSAHKLAQYVSSVFPFPPVSMFERSLDRYDWTLSLSSRLRAGRVRPGPYGYSKLYLVGHSLGGVIIRRWIADELQPFLSTPDIQPRTPVLVAKTRLFAPAHLGFSPTGLTGAAFNVSQQLLIGRVLEATMYKYRAYAHLRPNSRTITDLRTVTESLAAIYPAIESLSVDLLWGEDEEIVEAGRYTCDLSTNEQYVTGKGHRDICKPTSGFNLPLKFIERGASGV